MKKTICILITGLTTLSGLHAQDRAATDPFVRNGAQDNQADENIPRVISICVENFSLDLNEASALYQQKMGDTKLYAELRARVAKNQAKQETFSVIRARTGEKALVESLSEHIYPTEYDHGTPANTPVPAAAAATANGNKQASTPTATPATISPATPPILPTAFETRNTGITVEIEPTLTADGRVVDLRIAPDFTTLAERVKWGQGTAEAELPIFESQRITLATSLITGQPQLLGTPSRPPVSKVDADSANRVWFCFVTADVIPVVKEP
ncbi:hypothetical protein OKA04_22955 [Luteolibacter flavescens]|uniref:Uncharacterized protein n=1 Tax=Luteolibacter flavescens TaxID=1859460 RepID=A0ABT3FVK5_9BACT|nr:hypothetical protein [Luteolibacter flavescens]MCW1887615.1 hypothetical protein [Luteolibacter flavescens]